jgi:SAM-dependent methyltransferase
MEVDRRLNPSRSDVDYVHLTELRRCLEASASQVLAKGKTKLLDFGCGRMPYRPVIEPLVGRYIGADLASNPLAEVWIDETTGRADLPDASADVIFSTQVLEHVPDPPGYLRESLRLLRPGGQMILTTHGYWVYHPTPTDFWRWTGAGLRKVIEDSGFEVETVNGHVGPAAAAVQIFQDSVRQKLPTPLQPAFCFCLQNLKLLINSMYRSGPLLKDAEFLLVIARKP